MIQALTFSTHGCLPSEAEITLSADHMTEQAWTIHCSRKTHLPSDVNFKLRVYHLTKDYAEAARQWCKGTLTDCTNILLKAYDHGIVDFAYLGFKDGVHDCAQSVNTIFPRFQKTVEKKKWGHQDTLDRCGQQDPLYDYVRNDLC